ncbi:MAG: hypothetical protein GF315_05395 [candidate division Zixibacteria bacterium]|nr:hypothetical protein [candidate division Zixibacteria bacterium]
MTVRNQNLDAIGAVYATLDIYQDAGVDQLTDDDIGKAVTLTDNYECGLGSDGDLLLGRLMGFSPYDANDGQRKAVVQITGVMTLPIVETYPTLGDRIVVDGAGSIKQAPALTGYDPAGGTVARGTVVSVSGTSTATILLN